MIGIVNISITGTR